ncbi:hypothetical protein BLOT_012243 [Blomia tropicalis]|nr:hypothetical protein BLOT_012243 [Blomia tropicalis]
MIDLNMFYKIFKIESIINDKEKNKSKLHRNNFLSSSLSVILTNSRHFPPIFTITWDKIKKMRIILTIEICSFN